MTGHDLQLDDGRVFLKDGGTPVRPDANEPEQHAGRRLGAAWRFTRRACGLYLDAVTSNRVESRRARKEIHDAHFRCRARIPEVSVSELCKSVRPVGSTPSSPLAVPIACLESSLGGPGYYLTIARVTAALQPAQVVEFGTFLGVATTIFTMNAPECRILTIDLPEDAGDLSHLNRTDVEHVRTSRMRVGQCYRGTAHEARITEIKADSRELVLRQHVESADLILIDGGHDTGCITADTKNAFAVAHPGTVMLWDDYFWLYPDVVEFLDALAVRYRLLRIEGTNVVAHIVE